MSPTKAKVMSVRLEGDFHQRLKIRLVSEDGDGWVNFAGIEPMRNDKRGTHIQIPRPASPAEE